MPTIKSSPYDWPWNGEFSIGELALIIVNSPIGEGERADPHLSERIRVFADLISKQGGTVIEVTCDVPRVRRQVSLRKAASANHMRAPIFAAATAHVQASGIDAFYSSPLEQLLRDESCNLIIFCGRWLETSIHSTLREANDRGMECLVLRDLCDALDQEIKEHAISQIEMSGGIFGAVSSSTDLIPLIHPNVEQQAQ